MQKAIFLTLTLLFSCFYQNDSIIESNHIVESSHKEDKMDTEIGNTVEMKKSIELNRYVSKFIWMDNFDIKKYEDQDLICFAIKNSLTDDFGKFKMISDTFSMAIDEKYIERKINKYFGIEEFHNHQSIKERDIVYKEKQYFIPMADGESLVFGQVYDIHKENEIIKIYTKIYSEDDCSINVFIPIEEWSEKEKKGIRLVEKMILTVKEVGNEDEKKYIVRKIEKFTIEL